MEIHMRLSDACPAGTATCNDVTAINLLLPLFPVAVVLAFLFAWPLNRFLPLRPLFGWSLAIIGGAVYLYFATGPSGGSLLGFFVSVIGIGLARGKARTLTGAVMSTPIYRDRDEG
jgi:hypothetical protein